MFELRAWTPDRHPGFGWNDVMVVRVFYSP